MKTIIVFLNVNEGVYFFSTNRFQQSTGFVPKSYDLPIKVNPNPFLPNGVVNSKVDLKKAFYHKFKEILNPDPNYQM